MSNDPYDDVLKMAKDLTAHEKQKLIEELSSRSDRANNSNGKTLGECMKNRGLLGIASGPTDLSTNQSYMEGFGDDIYNGGNDGGN